MRIPRRNFLHLVACVTSSSALSRVAWAQTYPARPVRLMVGFSAGGPRDTLARMIGQWLSERFGQPFVTENRPGAGGNIAAELVARAAPDGHTLLSIGTSDVINAALYRKLSFNVLQDIVPVAGIGREPSVMVVNSTVPATTIPAFIAYANANPGKLGLGVGGVGTPGHVAGELFRMMTSVDLVIVPYRGAGPALADVLAGTVQVYIGPASASIDHIRSGKLRALAVTTATRWEALPDVSTMTEFLPGYEASTFFGIGAPRNTPAEVVHRLNKEINAGLADSRLKARIAALGGTALPGLPDDFGKLVASEADKWAKVVRSARISTE